MNCKRCGGPVFAYYDYELPDPFTRKRPCLKAECMCCRREDVEVIDMMWLRLRVNKKELVGVR